MDYFFNQKIAKNMAYLLNVVFLCIHIFLFIFFTYYRVHIMAYINIASMLFYFCGFVFIKRGRLAQYVYFMAFEVIIHMILAVICLGLGYGFQMCLVCIVSVFFYAEYFSLRLNNGRSKVSGSLLSVVSFISYIALNLVMESRQPIYTISDSVQIFMCIIMTFITFSVLIVSLKIMTMFFINNEQRLSKQAEYDVLTGLPNRHFILKHLNSLLEKKQAESCWLAMIDIDNFKRINDTYGHNFGDKALKAIAEILTDERNDVTVCRWGGEEFLIVGSLTEASRVPFDKVDGIRRRIEEYELIYEQENKRVPLTVTIGAAVYESGACIEDWVSIADKRLYVGKYNGKNMVVC